MAKKKVSELTAFGLSDVIIDQDLFYISKDNDGIFESLKITALRFGEELADYSAFYNGLVANTTFTSNLANNTVFVNALVDNDTFITDLVTDATFVTELTSNATFINNIVTEVNADDVWVNTTGDRMTGTLEFQHPSATDEFVIQPTADGDLNISPTNMNDNLFLAVSNVDPSTGGTGSVIAGRFRCSVPVTSAAANDVLESTGAASAVIEYNSASAGTIYIRKNNGTAGDDFFLGNYFSLMQRGAGAPTLAGQTANVNLLIPTGFLAKPRGQYSVITATLVQVDVTAGPSYNNEYWLISGDLAEAP